MEDQVLHLQIRWTIPCGNDALGDERLARWKAAAALVMNGNPKLFNTWIRQVLDAEAHRLLNPHSAPSSPPSPNPPLA